MTTRNRGKETGDDALFGSEKTILKIREALKDMSYLLSRNYPEKASSELVGNNYKLKTRQIKVLRTSSASNLQLKNRKSKQLFISGLKDKIIYLDGFNIVILLESLLSGAYIFQGLDSCYRDLSGVHGTYKRVSQTQKSIELVSSFFKKSQAEKLIWVFDKPVSNSGRIKQLISSFAEENQLNWEMILENNPDKYLIEQNDPIISSDAWILDECKNWFNLIDFLITEEKLEVNLINLYQNESV